MARREAFISESNLLVILAALIGALGGLGAVGLHRLIELFHTLFFSYFAEQFSFLGPFSVAVAPVAGALVAGPLIFRFAIEAKGHGVPEVMEAVALKGGRIRRRVALVKAFASAVTIGSGGSAGREGPIVQIGATLGSTVAGAFRMSERRTRTLVAAGAASGIAAAFNAPLAGVFFALEVVLQRFSANGFATVVLAAVTSSTVWRSFYGNAPVFSVPVFSVRHPVELVFYTILGLLAALVAAAFVDILYRIEDRFDGMTRLLPDLRPAAGAIAVGLLGVMSPLLFGSGIDGINAALAGELALGTALFLLLGKFLATAFTLGSGASGGVFSPALFMGSMLGAGFGGVLHTAAPDLTAPAGAYALVGMAAVFAAAAQAPISSILIVFEMTNDYRIMVPLMLSCVTATVVYPRLKSESVYTAKLARRGIRLTQGREQHLLETVSLWRALERNRATIRLPQSPEGAMQILEASNEDGLVVLGENGRYFGVLYANDLRDLLAKKGTDLQKAITKDVPTIRVAESLDTALKRLAVRDLQSLPVLDHNDKIVGVVTRKGIMQAYRIALAGSEAGSAASAPE